MVQDTDKIVQHHFNIRPRTMLESIQGVYCSLKPMNEARNDSSHPLNHFANSISVDPYFVQALHEMYTQFAVFTDFFDMKHTWQVRTHIVIRTY